MMQYVLMRRVAAELRAAMPMLDIHHGAWRAPWRHLAALAWWIGLIPALGQQYQPLGPGDEYRVVGKTTTSGYVVQPEPIGKASAPLALTGTMRIDYREKILRVDSTGKVVALARIYEQAESNRRIGAQDQIANLRPQSKRILLVRDGPDLVPFSPDGALTWAELDFLRHHPFLAPHEGLVTRAPLAKGKTWQADRAAVAELLQMTPIEGGEIRCEDHGAYDFAEQPLRQLGFTGEVTGLTPLGKARDRVVGAVYLDRSTLRLRHVAARGARQLWLRNGADGGRFDIEYKIAVAALYEDADLRSLAAHAPAQPSDRQLELLYENDRVGLRLFHPRRWSLVSAGTDDLNFATPWGTVRIRRDAEAKEPAKFRTAALEQLSQSGLQPTAQGELLRADNAEGMLAHFQLRIERAGKPSMIDYWLVRRGAQAAALVGGCETARLAECANQAEAVIRRIEFLPKP